ncbi:hypothetical protein MFLO_12131 [Listeria floridensis FSL S10-1187]|uniref:ClbS/DfsB family four-helix bundle protein n=1 Tax=Listeria floridensis FSL S10-1187 TaxID=1265817 RepID=A0ABN0RCZ3_9LIST|nr:ClbS/DfsB family four-helix bundle protein [Listeria floridensis]EUJ28492.1 hypothetical protein MFLO_12131 [Listeria floridensis FSL S10-1187]
MARPTNKQDLLDLSGKNWDALTTLVESMPLEQQNGSFPFDDRDKNIRDVLIHLHEWHNMMETWYEVGMRGEKPAIPKAGYTFQTLPALNLEIWKAYQDVELPEAKERLRNSHKRIMELINSHSDEELFTKKYYKWTNSTSLGAYFISSTSSHYDWAIKKN